MISLLFQLLRLFPFLFGGHQLALKNLALRQQLTVYKRTARRPKFRRTDRLLLSEAVCQDLRAICLVAVGALEPRPLGKSSESPR